MQLNRPTQPVSKLLVFSSEQKESSSMNEKENQFYRHENCALDTPECSILFFTFRLGRASLD